MDSPLPDRLRAARQAAGMTQRQLGEYLGMEPNLASARMTQYEKGQHAPNFQLLKRLSEALEVPIPYFFCEDDTVAELILELDKLDPAERQRLLEQLKKGSAPSES
ncbi:helix-turn-helix domain-containing protein [Vreelandella alkaliphila]|jgi:transcriptional regulator with XRE-family HTH domain|uniref:Helix-turn-helix transcriptional regulator n=3 Tax=Halomonadaceae TaxID=28256 RepID=A0A7Z0RYN3_9GAMM|nr:MULTISPECIES: helix-turn-helix transcriptional regulator [Halomonas]MBE0464502.1 helix-turn-helix transcriptional regulator [Halomonas colorata]MBR9924467.1 helix-turn-helix transcriptional regulator [Gammaproteobacteria bacterium]HBS82989.1 XRE family transcriptional regulator [Halomonas campaniensis]AQU82241.1 transcriptional regulator [Halomonas sp. 'Soap Lake \|tara:strand:+ start:1945 stop:2262 length:318 start_codon:yes stop_codon:yes gene_type:complete